MNLGIYIKNFDDDVKLEYLSKYINHAIDNKLVKDASLFYDDIGHNPFAFKCGIFNSTDLWNFNGSLVTTSLSCAINSMNIVNNFDIFYYYGWENKLPVLDLMYLIANNIKIICRDDDQEKYLKRITGKNINGITKDFSNLIEIVGKNE